MDISFNVAEALDKLDMMSFEEAQEWIAELDKETVARMAEFILGSVRVNSASGTDLDFLATIPTFPEVSGESVEDRRIRYKQACDDVLLSRGKNTKTIEPEFKDGSCAEWLNKLANKDKS